MGIELWISSVHFNSRLAWLLAKHHVLLRQVIANTNFCSNQFWFFQSLRYSPLHSQVQSVRPCRWYLPFENSIYFRVRSNLPKFPWASSHSSGKFRTVLCSRPVLLYYHRFHEARYVCARRGMLLLLALPILFQRYLRYRPWSFKPFEINSFSILRCHTIGTISMYRSVGHDCKWLRLPEFQSLILRLWQSYPVHCFLVILRNIRCFLWNCEVVMRLLFLRVISKRIRWC